MEGIGITIAIVLGILNAFVLGIKMRKDSRGNKNPGRFPCSDHGERLARLETNVKNIKEDIREIKNKVMED